MRMKKRLFLLFRRLVNLFQGSGLGKIPPVYWVYSLIFRSLRPARGVMDVDGLKMSSGTCRLPPSFDVAFQGGTDGGWEVETTRLFKQLTGEGDIVVDIGANIGYYTLLAARIVGEHGKVYAFEPDPTNCGVLTGNVKLNGFYNVEIIPKAVSDRKGQLELYLDEKNAGAHSIYRPKKVKRSVVVDSITLDEYFQGREHPVNIVKMDIEGAEIAALSGMRRIIEKNENLKIFTEFHPPWVSRAGVSPEYFISELFDRYHFSVTVILDYARPPGSRKIAGSAELLDILQDYQTVNLLLEKKP